MAFDLDLLESDIETDYQLEIIELVRFLMHEHNDKCISFYETVVQLFSVADAGHMIAMGVSLFESFFDFVSKTVGVELELSGIGVFELARVAVVIDELHCIINLIGQTGLCTVYKE